ncbi:hypothetical protein ABZS71_16495 [Streptomyces sp. NPDC005393]|uniref:hypothetical protein n=1 Tax=Streptomyces sp. NPDC005393 TaxID=3157041 RepID=UPI0033B3365D
MSHLRCKGAEVYVGEGFLAVDWGPGAGLRVPAQWCASVTLRPLARQDAGAQLVFEVRTGGAEATGFLKFRLDVEEERTGTAGRFVEDIRRECGIEDVAEDDAEAEDDTEAEDGGEAEDIEAAEEESGGAELKAEDGPLLRVPYGEADWIAFPAGPVTEELYADVVERLVARQAGQSPGTD